MIGKLIAYGSDRKSAIARMRQALAEMIIEGIQTNNPLQSRIMRDPVYKEGTHHIDRKRDVEGKSVAVRGDLGGRRIIKKKTSREYDKRTSKHQIKQTRTKRK